MIQNKYMKEENHFTQTLLPAHITALAALLSFSLILFTYSHNSLSFCSQIIPLFIGINGKIIGHQLWHKWWQHMVCTLFANGWYNFHCNLSRIISLFLRVDTHVVAH
ncbi:hypothetical protein NC651_018988 [Populus alba x Populus x berolinensis]|nr:hypothetical protein NC651_018988 [Populus alba x Populus x berolinensis]